MKLGTQRRQLPVVVKAGATYFALVFGAGFILGPIRILLDLLSKALMNRSHELRTK
jgi:hypothetical protein